LERERNGKRYCDLDIDTQACLSKESLMEKYENALRERIEIMH